MDIITYALARKYVQDTLAGMGALKGAPCTIESITRVEGGNKIVFSWTGSDGSVQRQEMFVADGASGGGSDGTGSGLPASVQSDWNQNDPNAADYVKGRTHYDATNKVSSTQLQSFIGPEFQSTSGGIVAHTNEYMVKVSDLTPALSVMQETGYIKYRSEYKLGSTTAKIVDATDKGYTLVVGSRTTFYTRAAVVLSPGYAPYQVYDDTGKPSRQHTATLTEPGIYLFTTGAPGTEIYVRWNELVPLDEKFIPDTIARVADAETEDDALEMLTEMGIINPVTNEEDNIFTDENGNIFIV